MQEKLTQLRRLLVELRCPLIAFSGGLDSRFLAHTAHQLQPEGVTPLLVHCQGPHVPEEETASAKAFAAARGLPLTLVDFSPTVVAEVRRNDLKRCYHCKKALFSAFLRVQNDLCPENPPPLCDGTNASDLGLYRPGLQALQELGIRSPLAEAGLSKDEIRAAARAGGLENPEQQARPCLLTRFVYDLEPTAEALIALGKAEAALADLLGPAENFRLRLFPPDAFIPSGYLPFAAELHLERPLSPDEEQAARLFIKDRRLFCRAISVSEKASGTYDAELGLGKAEKNAGPT